ncbi:phage tail sheath C-terminal domain-containing protein [Modestobacter altitudinis]|uniref:phage tail sheath C-terminal domain-containing protein n=1 Tax=Modestobacter altitudinis TaxID=2213158 RepID=UPI00110D0BD4|nr:phage tail sheath C-terminal domain-containing protein [Modestobacter altitudinis]
MPDGIALGAPGVYIAPPVPQPRTATEPMDVAAFVGVAPRGPAYEPADDPSLLREGARFVPSVAVPVDSWDAYLEAFGGFSGPGLLPHAVAAYFGQGGRRAYVLRIVHRPGGPPVAEPPGCARYRLPNGLLLRARNEGSWGDRLTVQLRFVTRVLAASVRPLGRGPDTAGPGLLLQPGAVVPVGSLLRIRPAGRAPGDDATPDAVLCTVTELVRVGRPDAVGSDLVARLDRVPPAPGPLGEQPVVELVEGELTVVDHDPERPRAEGFPGLGLRTAHPRSLHAVLLRESRLLAPVDDDGAAGAGDVSVPVDLPALAAGSPECCGEDRWHLVTEQDLFGAASGEETAATEGIEVLAGVPEVATLVVPDLYALPVHVTATSIEVGAGSPAFRSCRPAPTGTRLAAGAARPLELLVLDVTDPDQLQQVVTRQRRLVEVAERTQVVALLDVPPGLRTAQVLRWRSWFDSSCAAAYHPWLRAPGPVPGGPLVDVPPSAVAAGVIARCELRDGISRGPGNERAVGVVDLADLVDDAAHAELHRLGVDVFRLRPDGVWLTGARTLSGDPALRQLTVRRLLLMLVRVLRRQLAWTVFEPGGGALRAGLRRHLEQVLRDLADDGAFAGATPEESWFLLVGRPDEEGPGRLVVQVGVAPAEPMEFVVVRVVLDAEGAIEAGLDVGAARVTAVGGAR